MDVYSAITAANTASSSPVPTIDIGTVLQYGLLGLVFLCIIFRKYLVPEWTLKQAEERHAAEKQELAERLNQTREQLDRLQDVFQDQMIPVLTRATEVNARYLEELQQRRLRDRKSPETEE